MKWWYQWWCWWWVCPPRRVLRSSAPFVWDTLASPTFWLAMVYMMMVIVMLMIGMGLSIVTSQTSHCIFLKEEKYCYKQALYVRFHLFTHDLSGSIIVIWFSQKEMRKYKKLTIGVNKLLDYTRSRKYEPNVSHFFRICFNRCFGLYFW